MTAFRLRFDDAGLERRFRRDNEPARDELVRAGFGFLVVLFGGIAVAQVYFAGTPLVTNMVYAGLGLAALFAFSLCRPRALPAEGRLHRLLATAIPAGAIAAVFAPGGAASLQLTAAAIAVVWFGLFSGLGVRWVRNVLGLAVFPAIALAGAASVFLAPQLGPALCALLFATGFAGLAVYTQEHRARRRYLEQQQPLQAVGTPRQGAARAIRPDKSFQLIKELTIELSDVSDADAFYAGLLRYFQRAVRFQLAAVGRLRNDRMLPVMIRPPSGEGGGEETVKQLWRAQLVRQLNQTKSAIAGDAEPGLLDSDVQAGEIHFGHRLDIPFFSQGKLDGVVTLLRPQPAFSEAEAALAAGMVFHGLFAHRSARLQRRVEKNRQPARPAARPAPKTANGSAPASDVLSVDEFLRQANDAFETARARGTPVSLLLIELDQHDDLTERYGAAAGHRVFDAVARLVVEHREPGAILGRYGEGSLAMQLPLPLAEAKTIAEHLRAAIRKHPLRIDGARVDVSVSVGVSARDASSVDFLSLLRGADIGLYLARDGAGNSVRVHS
jgi:diguanylate cyclase (GGDEF)-like protein